MQKEIQDMFLTSFINRLHARGLHKTIPIKLALRIINVTLRKDPHYVKSKILLSKETNQIIVVLQLKYFPFARYIYGRIIVKTVRDTIYLIDKLGYHIEHYKDRDGLNSFTESKFVKAVDDYNGQLTLFIQKGRIKYHYLIKQL